MNTTDLLAGLGYLESPNFLRSDDARSFQRAADVGHIFRRAKERCSLKGVYSLRLAEDEGRDTVVPVVYVCEARDDEHAEKIHRQVWNQNVVPFLIISSPKEIRLYSGFRYELRHSDSQRAEAGMLRAARDMHKALDYLNAFQASRIDDGSLWEEWGAEVTPETRVDGRLLSSLNELDLWLQKNGLKAPEVSHALIGKYVYLNYLRQRNILSDKKLAEWDLRESQVFGRRAQLSAFWRVVDELDEWLNGSVFPLGSLERHRLRSQHIQQVAGTFAGDEPGFGQLALDFGLYDFSLIPIETLSVIYEQFLHSPGSDTGPNRGRSEGAYYTPLPLVNFMLEELDSLKPFKNGMRVLDPACGSGAFLVQCYRRIIEGDTEFRAGQPMRPARLRDLLVGHIFGIDRDGDACRVTELSLSLTLLDYIDPPDLSRTPTFQLPKLLGANIQQGDFFDSEAHWCEALKNIEFDWIVGNPPWIEPKGSQIGNADRHAWRWMRDAGNRKQFPVGGNQVAEAFAWKVTELVSEDGYVALVLPAMTLFKDESAAFRRQFFSTLQVYAVANFANMAYVLFPGHKWELRGERRRVRSTRPAAALFYSRKRTGREHVTVFSPLVAEQQANRPTKAGAHKDIWNIVVDSSQVRSLDLQDVCGGAALPWKTAMWGSHLDLRFLETIQKRFPRFEDYRLSAGLKLSEGLQLRQRDSSEAVEAVPEVIGQLELKTKVLRGRSAVFEFPDDALERVKEGRAFARRGRRDLPLSVCFPPHIIVDKLRRFAVYSEDFIVVPPRQIGIAGKASQSKLLKALSLYLVSDFALYHQFLLSPEWGISTSISTLDTLRALPVPFSSMDSGEVEAWAELRDRIVSASRMEHQATLLSENSNQRSQPMEDLLRELNKRVATSLRLNNTERALLHDLLHVRMQLIQGKTARYPLEPPSREELRRYAQVLATELDAFVTGQQALRHSITVAQSRNSAIVAIAFHDREPPAPRIQVTSASGEAAEHLRSVHELLRRRHSQWVYFQRNLRLYEGRTTYVVKPLQRLHWTDSQAVCLHRRNPVTDSDRFRSVIPREPDQRFRSNPVSLAGLSEWVTGIDRNRSSKGV